VSHAGNLPRPDSIDTLVNSGKNLHAATSAAYRERLPQAVQHIVDVQIALGVDIVNDGEYAKAGSYGGYMQQRVTGYTILPADASRPPKRGGTAERARRPHIVYTSISCYGHTGPWRRRRGWERQDQAVAGIMQRTDAIPAILGPYNLVDIGTGVLGTFATALGTSHLNRFYRAQDRWFFVAARPEDAAHLYTIAGWQNRADAGESFRAGARVGLD
jgi:hypothetical protein